MSLSLSKLLPYLFGPPEDGQALTQSHQPQSQIQPQQIPPESKPPVNHAFTAPVNHTFAGPVNHAYTAPTLPPEAVENEHIVKELKAENSRLQKLLDKVHRLQNEEKFLKDQVAKARNSDLHKSILEEGDKKIQDLIRQIKAAEEQLVSQQQRLDAEEKEVTDKINLAHVDMERRMTQTENDCHDRHAKDIAALKEQLANRARDDLQPLETEYQNWQDKLKRAEDQLSDIRSRFEVQSPALVNQLAQVRAKNSELQAELAEIHPKFLEEYNNLRKELADTQKDLVEKKLELSQRNANTKFLDETAKQLLAEVGIYRSLVEKSPAKRARTEDTTEQPTAAEPSEPIEQPDFQSTVTPVRKSTSLNTRPTPLSRRSSITRTIQDGHRFLSSYSIKITEADASRECIVLTNMTDADILIGNWRLHSKRGNTDFRFPPGTMVPGSTSLTVWSGPEAETRDEDNLNLRWTPKRMLNTPKESVYLFDGANQRIQKISVINQPVDE